MLSSSNSNLSNINSKIIMMSFDPNSNTTKEIWKTLLITHQDSAFARFNTIITSLKALDEGYSSKNYVRKFLRALHPKWRAKMIINKDSEIVKAKGERKSLALKAKKESSDEECSTSGSEDKEYAIAVRDFKKFFKRRECPKPPKDKNQRAFVGGSWSDSGEEDDEKAKDETCVVAQASNEHQPVGLRKFKASSSGIKEIEFVKPELHAIGNVSSIFTSSNAINARDV
ncbi:hypothetical protein Tco_1142758 [Tanacetum coccineum]